MEEDRKVLSPIEQLRRKQNNKNNELCHGQTFIEPAITHDQILDISKSAMSNYFCVFTKIPNMIYYLQDFTLPAINNNIIHIARPWHSDNYPVAGHTTNYTELYLDFIMDEKFRTYYNILKWMRRNEWTRNIEETIGRASLVILNNAKIPIIRVDFLDVLPLSIGEIQFMNQSADPITFYSTFSFYNFSITYLDGSDDYLSWWDKE